MSDFSSEADRQFLDTSAPTTNDAEFGRGPGADDAGNDHGTGDDGTGDEGDGGVRFAPDRARLLGALIEKALATPQNYPLSLNALAMACNQTTNRDPIMDLTESEVETLLAEAKTDGWVRFVHPRSGRGVTKYRHVVDEVLHLDEARTALVGVLLLRGPQTAAELRSRTERLAPMDLDTVEQTLTTLSQNRPQPLVSRLEREPGHREQRWIQLLCPEQGEDRAGQPSAVSSPRRAVAAGSGEIDELRQELGQVKAELAELRAAFDALRDELGA